MEQFKINAIAHLIFDHLSNIRDDFFELITTIDDQYIEISMFHAIDNFAAEFYGIIKTYKNLDDWQEYRKKLIVSLSINRLFQPITDININELERLKINKETQIIYIEVMKKLKSDPLGRWSQIRSLKRELDLFNKYHVFKTRQES